MRARLILRNILLGLTIFSVQLDAQVLSDVVQITTHPATDSEPAVSNNGKWLAFTSDRSGNRDIWIKKLPHGQVTQVTTNPSDDHQPCWSPDGKWLVFVSHRRDALGDLWFLKIKKGKPQGSPIQLTFQLGAESHPAVSPDGRNIIFVSEREERKDLWILQRFSGVLTRLTFQGGTEPVWSTKGDTLFFISYRDNTFGDIFLLPFINNSSPFTEGGQNTEIKKITTSRRDRIYSQPYWIKETSSLVYTKYSVDTDKDNRITPLDKGAIWKTTFIRADTLLSLSGEHEEYKEIQLTTDIYSDQYPCTDNKESIYYSSERQGSQDIYKIPLEGLFTSQKSGYAQYSEAMEKSTEAVSKEELSQIILGYQRVLDYFPEDSVWAAKAMLQMGELYRIIGYPRKASVIYDQISQRYFSPKNEVAAAQLKKAELDIYSLDKRIDFCLQIIETYKGNSFISAQAWLVLGDLYQKKNLVSESLQCYSHIVNTYPDMRNLQPLARLKIGDIFRQAEQYEAAEQNYISVLREFKESPLWRKRAAERILGNLSGDPSKQISSLRKLIHNAEDLPSLQAQAQLRICTILMEDQQIQEAGNELHRIQTLFPALDWVQASSKIMLSEVFQKRGDDLKAMYLLQEVIEKYEFSEGGRYAVQAEEKLFNLLTSTAENLLQTGDFELAEVRFRWARKYEPHNIGLLRGMVEAGFRAGRGDHIIKELEDSVKIKPNDPVLLYGLGLALSFKGESDIHMLHQSNLYLKRALGYNYTLIYPYRTLSFNYELIEQLQSQEQDQDQTFWTGLWRVVTTPFRWLYGLLPFSEKKETLRYYEQAIDALITALELNDEQEDPEMEALLAQNLANNFYHLGEFGYKNASEYYRKRIAVDTTFNSMLTKALFYQRLGHCEAVLQLPQAEPVIKKAITLYKKLGRQEDEIRNKRILAFFYQLIEKYDESVSLYFQLVDYDQRRGNRQELMRDYRNLAYNLYLLAEYNDCLVYAQKCKSLLLEEKISLKPSRKNSLRLEIMGLSIPVWSMKQIGGASSEGFTPADELALIYGLISKSLEQQNSVYKAIEYENKRLDIFKKRRDKLAERVSYNRLGTLYYTISDINRAWEHFYQSLLISREFNDTEGSLINSLNLSNIAVLVQSRNGEVNFLNSAEQIVNQELENQQKSGGLFLPKQRVMLFSTLGTMKLLKAKTIHLSRENTRAAVTSILEQINEIQQAQYYFSRADSLAEHFDLILEKSILLKNLAEAAYLLEEYFAAYDYLEKSYMLLKNNGYERYIWRVLYGLAKIIHAIPEEERHQTFKGKSSLDIYLETIESMEQVKISAGKKDASWWESRDVYTDCCFELIRQEKYREALVIIEKGKQKEISDIITQNPPEFKRERHKLIWGNLKYIQSRLEQLQDQILRAKNSDKEKYLQKEWEKEKTKLEQEYEQFLADMRKEDPMLAYLSGADPVDVTEFQNSLHQNRTALYYLTGRKKSLVWVIKRDTIICKNLDIDEKRAGSLINDLLQHIQQDSSTVSLSRQLYDYLLAPVQNYLSETSDVLLITDNVLWDCPFEVLHDGREYVLDKFTTHYATTLSAYYLSTKQKKVNQKRVISVGSEQNRTIFSGYSTQVRDQTLLLGKKATEPRFLSLSENADIVHIERWISPRPDNPLLTSLVLFQGDGEDGYLSIKELFSSSQNATLFIIPPISSTGEKEYLSVRFFVETLLYSGTPCVQFNSWKLPTEIKREFYSLFFSYIGQYSEAEALQQAVKNIRDTYPALKFWRGFRLIGYQGMDEEDNKTFSRNNLVSMIKKGRAFVQDKDYDNAIRVLGEALDMVYTMDDSLTLMRVLRELVWTSVQGENWSKAVLYQKPLYNSAKVSGDLQRLVNTGNTLSTFYYRNGEYRQAAEIKRTILENIGNNPAYERANLYESLALIYSSGREFDKAVNEMITAAELYENRGDTASRARTEIWLGRFELEQDNFQKSIQHFQQAIGLFNAGANKNNEFQLASAYQLMGLAYERLSMYKKALYYQNMALPIFTDSGQHLQAAQSWQYIANVEWKTGSYRSAFTSQSKAMEGFKKHGTVKHLIMGYATLGLIKMSLGNFEQAFIDEQKALDLCNRNLEYASDKASVLKNLGLIMIQQKAFNQSLDYFREAARIDSSLNSERGLAYDYRNQGILELYLGNIQEGITLLERGLELSRRIGDISNQVRCLYGLARARNLLEENTKALLLLDKGLSLMTEVVMPEQEWRFYHLRGTVLSLLEDEFSALESYEKGIEVVEDMRAELGVESFKQGFIDTRMDIYSDIITHLLRMGREEQALNYVERAKSRSFLDMLSQERLDLSKADEQHLERLEAARDAVEEARMMVTTLSQKQLSISGKSELQSWQAELEERKQEYEQILVSLKAEHKQLTSLVSVRPWDVDRIKSVIPSGTAILEYFITENKIHSWIIFANQVHSKQVYFRKSDLALSIGRFRNIINNYLSTETEAKKLYQLLMEPAENYLTAADHLIIIPHGVLHYLPFCALQDKRGTYLIEKISLSIAPSSTVLGYCLEKKKSIPGDTRKTVVAYGNPDLGDERYNLPFAEKEVLSLQRTYDNITYFLGKQTTEEAVRNTLSDKDIIHFSCHATYDPKAPFFSALLLRGEDGTISRLEAREIYGLAISSELVTLSACKTGMGAVSRGDEIIGMDRSFLYAGTPAIISTLWSVDDLATAVAIKRFYRYLSSGHSKARALQKAQLIVKDMVNAHPAAWASFKLTGEFR